MVATSQRQSRWEGIISLLNAAIEAVNLAKEASGITPAKIAFASAGVLLTMIKVCFLLCDDRGSHTVRSRWSMQWITSTSGYSVPISAEA